MLKEGSYSAQAYEALVGSKSATFMSIPNIQPAVANGKVTSNIYNGNTSFNIEVSVGSLANDYDVDKLVSRIKEDLYN